MSSSALPLDEEVLVRLCEPLIRKAVYRHRSCVSRYVPLEDLLQLGRIAAIQAVRQWSPEGGASLTTFVFRNVQRICFNAHRDQVRQMFRGISPGEELPEIISLDMPTERFETDASGVKECVSDCVPSDVDVEGEAVGCVELAELRSFVASAFPGTDQGIHCRRVIEMRYGLADGRERFQKEVATELGISQMQVSRLERQALRRLRQVAEERGLADGLA